MDIRSERTSVEILGVAFPDHGVVAEEETKLNKPPVIHGSSTPRWHHELYAHGYPCFAVSIALKHEEDVILGVVYDPMRDELFVAQKGLGAYLKGKQIKVSTVDTLIKSLLATGFPCDRKVSDKNNLNYFYDLLMASQEVRRDGSAAARPLLRCYRAT
jgi:myo-inositol-1(or 4)-monophosphatase